MEGLNLERGPFGQALSLWLHRFPRNAGSDWDWELDRGFHLQVLGPSLFELNLCPRQSNGEAPTLSFLPGYRDQGATRLLIWQKAQDDEQGWELLSQALTQASHPRAGLILSRTSEQKGRLREHLGRRHLWKSIECPVVEIFQDTPASNFFTVEKSLFVLGRVARRLQRYSKVRQLLP